MLPRIPNWRRPTRRAFVQGAGMAGLGLLAGCRLPFSAAPRAARIHRIARLVGALPNVANEALMSAFRQGLRDLGYIEGQNLVIDDRHANSDEALAEPLAELVRLQPEVILVPSSNVARVVQAATTTIAIVSAGPGDLVANGLAASLARPGGNVTGLSTPSLVGKQLQLFQEAVPALSRVAVLVDTTNPGYGRWPWREPYEAAARTLGLELQFVGARGPEDLELSFETAIREHVDGLFVALGAVISANLTRIAELAMQGRLPLMWQQSEAVSRGGLLAYGPNRADMYRHAASFVDKILKGRPPADLPVEQPRAFDFVINRKTARALGLTIPERVLLQVTEVIE